MGQASKSQKFATLDILRGVGAFAVMVFHFKKLLPYGEVWGCVSGYLAVDLFFVLSGFVLAHAYDRRLDVTLTPGAFAIQRFARLLPMIWVGSLLGLVIGLGKGHGAVETVRSAALGLFALPSYVSYDRSIFPLNSAEWSLFFEIFINLVFAYFFRALRGPMLWLLIGASAVMLLVFALSFGTLSGGWEWSTFQVGFARVGFSFFLGVQLSRTYEVWSKHVPKVPAFVLVLVLVLLFEVRPSPAVRPFFDLAFIVLLSPALVMLGAVAECKQEKVVKYMGGMSYPLYAIHDPLVGATRGLVKKFDVLSGVLPLALVVVLPFVAYGFAVLYDAPLRAFLTQTVARGRRAVARPSES
ncbi:acyltransferase [Phenylobacterium sp. LjRoot225]|uniref:acyltransferase family protein n=1 Tax=Phenylobacterium sp. LjRoot225 TaxID=3342285 RepID=UPI003ECC31BA